MLMWDFHDGISRVCLHMSVCGSGQCYPPVFLRFISLPQVTPFRPVLEVIMTFSARFKVFSLGSSHSICVNIEKRPNIREQLHKVNKGHRCSYTTRSSLTLSGSVQQNTTYETEHNTVTVGKSLMRNKRVGGCFSPLIRKKSSLCSWLLLESSKKLGCGSGVPGRIFPAPNTESV